MTFWKPGNIVRLKKPFKPVMPQVWLLNTVNGIGLILNTVQRRRYYEEIWKGFTHGIIVQIAGHDYLGHPLTVALHLYDPNLHLLYVEEFNNGIPTYIDYSIDELEPVKDRDIIGYETIFE